MLNPDWRRLTCDYIRQQKLRDQKLESLRERMPPSDQMMTFPELLEIFRCIREILSPEV